MTLAVKIRWKCITFNAQLKGNKVQSLEIVFFLMNELVFISTIRVTKIIILVTKILVQHFEGGLKCCAIGKPEELFLIEWMLQ